MMLYRWCAVGLLCAALACGTAAHAAQLKIGMSSTADLQRSGTYVWVKAFTAALESDGWQVSVFPSSALGREDERSVQVSFGLLEVDEMAQNEIAMYAPLYAAIGLPFLFDDVAHFTTMVDTTSFLAAVNERARRVDVRVVDVALLGGMSGIFTARRRLTSLDDLKGVRLRAMDRKDLTLLAAWGLAGTQVAWEEVAQALQTGVADGYMNPPMAPVLFGHVGRIKYYADVGIWPSSRAMVVSDRWYRGLSAGARAQVDRAVAAGRDANRRWAREMHELTVLRGVGIEVTQFPPADRTMLVNEARGAYARLIDPDVLREAMRFVDAAR